MDSLNPKTDLIVDILGFNDDKWTVRIHLYDQMTKITDMSRWAVREIEGDPGKRGLVTVDNMGSIGDKTSIVLPEPIHDMGTNISVNSDRISEIKRPIEAILKEAMEKKE